MGLLVHKSITLFPDEKRPLEWVADQLAEKYDLDPKVILDEARSAIYGEIIEELEKYIAERLMGDDAVNDLKYIISLMQDTEDNDS